MSTEQFNLQNLTPLTGDPFIVKNDQGGKVTVTLSEVSEYQTKDSEIDSFTAIFSNEKGALAEDGVYIIEHPVIGECRLCFSLNSAEECEVVVSRLKTAIE